MFGRCARLMQNWRVLHQQEDAASLDKWAGELEERSSRPPRITWACAGNHLVALASGFGDSVNDGHVNVWFDTSLNVQFDTELNVSLDGANHEPGAMSVAF
jgi:hypothetical protein